LVVFFDDSSTEMVLNFYNKTRKPVNIQLLSLYFITSARAGREKSNEYSET
jgi:hypothetical protein